MTPPQGCARCSAPHSAKGRSGGRTQAGALLGQHLGCELHAYHRPRPRLVDSSRQYIGTVVRVPARRSDLALHRRVPRRLEGEIAPARPPSASGPAHAVQRRQVRSGGRFWAGTMSLVGKPAPAACMSGPGFDGPADGDRGHGLHGIVWSLDAGGCITLIPRPNGWMSLITT